MNDDPQVIQNTEDLADGVYVALGGEIDLSSSPALRHELLAIAARKPGRLVVDLTDVPYMDSSGVATLVEAFQQQRKNSGRMVLCGLQAKVRSIFEIARLDMVFDIVDDKQAAVSA